MKSRVLIVSFDALRPDMVTPDLMPNLCKFVAEGAYFPEARSTFPTETRVNQTAMITGCYPERHGIVGNRFQDEDASPGKLFNTGDETQLAEGDKRLGGKLVDIPVLGEILDANGLSYAVISAGTPGGTRMLNHKAENLGGFRLSLHRPDATQPAGAIDKVLETCGPIPPHSVPSLNWIRYATDVYLDYVEPNLIPDVMVLWYCEPDNSYHQIGLGTPENLEALRTVDREFGRILAWEAEKPPEERLHIVTMSDHGMVTLLGSKLDLAAKFREAGFTVGETTEDGSDLALALSSAGGIYVNDSDPALIQRVLVWLQVQDWCGPLFTRTGDGALLHEHIRTLHRRAADIGIVLKSDDGQNGHGIAGGTVHDCGYPEGGGMHGGLHEREVRCWLAMQGPDVRNGYTSPVTAGVVDILPTVLNFLNIDEPKHIQGRLLREGLEAFAKETLPECHREHHSAKGANGYQAHIEHDYVGERRYLRRAWSERV
jgi:arylsulfatase A-like enzyme